MREGNTRRQPAGQPTSALEEPASGRRDNPRAFPPPGESGQPPACLPAWKRQKPGQKPARRGRRCFSLLRLFLAGAGEGGQRRACGGVRSDWLPLPALDSSGGRQAARVLPKKGSGRESRRASKGVWLARLCDLPSAPGTATSRKQRGQAASSRSGGSGSLGLSGRLTSLARAGSLEGEEERVQAGLRGSVRLLSPARAHCLRRAPASPAASPARKDAANDVKRAAGPWCARLAVSPCNGKREGSFPAGVP